MTGVVFDIKEFALGDGDGIRTTVFMKGCPLRCIWCHNPEGLSPYPELYFKQNACKGCGLCRVPCNHEECRPFGRCTRVCPDDLVTIVGKTWEADALAKKLTAGAEILNSLGGGITFSGGEPLYSADFVCEVASQLRGKTHLCIETSGFADNETFMRTVKLFDLVIMDIKLADPAMHKKYTGVDNGRILENARALSRSGIAHIFRTPLIPGITDTKENLTAISRIVGDDRIELLPYNTLAATKYKSVGRTFTYTPENTDHVPDISFFKNAVLK